MGVEDKVIKKKADFYRLPAHFYQQGDIIVEDLYLRDKSSYVLFRPKNLTWKTEDRSRLKDFNIESLFIKCEDKDGYTSFVENHLDRILEDPELKNDEKSEILYKTSRDLISNIFNSDEVPKSFRRSLGVVKHSIGHIGCEGDHMFQLIDLARRNYSEYSHAVHVAAYGIKLAQQRGIKAFNHLAALGIASLLHDIGKVKIDQKVLNKKGKLDRSERAEVQRHVQYGYELAKEAESVSDMVAELILQHHELPSGKGYPQKLSENQLTPLAHIISLCERYDSMRTDRPYQKALSKKEAFKVLQAKYSQDLVDDFMKVVGKI